MYFFKYWLSFGGNNSPLCKEYQLLGEATLPVEFYDLIFGLDGKELNKAQVSEKSLSSSVLGDNN
jgi:hypothetical protein